MDELEIEIINWEKYNGRQDVKSHTWFRMQNDFFFAYRSPPLRPLDVTVFLLLLCVSSRRQGGVVAISRSFLSLHTHSRKYLIAKSLTSLEQNQMIRVLPCTTRVTDPCTTDRQTNKQTDRQDKHVPLGGLEYRDLKDKTSEELRASICARHGIEEVGK